MKKVLIVLIVLILGTGGYFWYKSNFLMANPKGLKKLIADRKLEKYDFDSLRKRGGKPGKIEILGEASEVNLKRKTLCAMSDWRSKRLCEESDGLSSSLFQFESNGKKISGVINFRDPPLLKASEGQVKWPTIIMVRGFADSAGYYPGSGSWKAADEFFKVGFNTVSIDFLGFGKSDNESTDILEARFEKVVSVLDLLESVKKLPFVDSEKIGFWSHSNGGQITLSVLEISGGNYPSVLWAPMTNPFPKSVLDTASSTNDSGKLVIAKISEFQNTYDVRKYAFENYYRWINSPIIIRQGTNDEWCQVSWQERVRDSLVALGKKAEVVVYDGDDHNLSKSWDEAVSADIDFFKSHFNQ